MNYEDNWGSWGKHVLKTLEENSEKIDNLSEEISKLKVEIGKLQVYAALWGGVASVAITFILGVFK